MKTDVLLPQWLDDLIFRQMGAKYCRSNKDITVIDWDKNDVLNYLGTYFPRSYAEAYCIFTEFFKRYPNKMNGKKDLNIFDFGCGTGGEIIGLLMAANESIPYVEKFSITAMDGNFHSLRLLEQIMENYRETKDVPINLKVLPITIDDFYDLSVLDRVITDKYDLFLTSKAICEFVSKEQFEKKNPYANIAKTFLPKMCNNGIMLFTDVTSYSGVSQEWLPKMMDKGLKEVGCEIILKNIGFNQIFNISHRERKNDISKIAWRIIKKM